MTAPTEHKPGTLPAIVPALTDVNACVRRLLRAGCAVLLIGFVAAGCAQSRTGATASLPERQSADGEEQPNDVPPDRYKDVQYRGGRDPVSGQAPGLDGTIEKSALPPPKGKSATPPRTATANAVPTGKTASGKPKYDDAYRPPAKSASASSPRAAPSSTDAPSASNDGETIVVRSGDTVQSIANRYNVPVGSLMQANNLRSNRLTPGQRLVLPD